MAQSLITTSNQSEGSDELRDFLLKHRARLKLNNDEKLNTIYHKLNAEIDYEDLLQFSEADLRASLNTDCALSNTLTGKIISIMRQTQDSTIYKQTHSSKIVLISTEEDAAVTMLKQKGNAFDKAIKDVCNVQNTLNTNSKTYIKTINTPFDIIVANVQKEREKLLTQLNQIKNRKDRKLLTQQNTLKQYRKRLTDAHTQCTQMLHDISLDKDERKRNILSIAHTLQSNPDVVDIDHFKAITNGIINVKVELVNINKALSNVGVVTDGDTAVAAPRIVVQDVTHSSVRIMLCEEKESNKNVIEYKIEYSGCVNGNDDEKLQWISDVIKYQKNVEYTIGSLDALKTYLIRAALKDMNGYGLYSKSMTVTTERDKGVVFDTISKGSEQCIKNKGKTIKMEKIEHTVTVCSSKGWNTGVHEWKIQPKQECEDAFGIVSDFSVVSKLPYKWIPNRSGNHKSFALRGSGYMWSNPGTEPKTALYGIKWKANDIVIIRLDCNEWKLNFMINNKQCGKEMDITKHQTYYPMICSYHTSKTVEYNVL